MCRWTGRKGAAGQSSRRSRDSQHLEARKDPRNLTGDLNPPLFPFWLARFDVAGNQRNSAAGLCKSARGRTTGEARAICASSIPEGAIKSDAERRGYAGGFLCEGVSGVRGGMAGCLTVGPWSARGVLCGETSAAHDQSNQELAGAEPEGEDEFGSRVEDTAHTPNFWA